MPATDRCGLHVPSAGGHVQTTGVVARQRGEGAPVAAFFYCANRLPAGAITLVLHRRDKSLQRDLYLLSADDASNADKPRTGYYFRYCISGVRRPSGLMSDRFVYQENLLGNS